jgi:SAM-dependent methyltransferase
MADWDERYRAGTYASLEPNPLLPRTLRDLKPGAALDLACGAGRHSLVLAEHGWSVTAVDSSVVGIDLLRNRAAERDLAIDARVVDLERGEFKFEPDTYDLICDFYYLQRELFPSIRTSIKPGGVLLAAIHFADDASRDDPSHHPYMLDAGELRTYFRDWEIIHYHETHDTDTDAGQHHKRTAELIARRPLAE